MKTIRTPDDLYIAWLDAVTSAWTNAALCAFAYLKLIYQ